jgi:uncharacterized repeat protein (TIGR03803 family)
MPRVNLVVRFGFAIAVSFLLSACAALAQTESVLHNFGLYPDAGTPFDGVIFDASGNLYGATFAGGTYSNGAIFELSQQAGGGWSEQVIYSFGASSTEGLEPFGGLILDKAGNLYGTTYNGGTAGAGTVFELSPGSGGWTIQILHSFQNNGVDGANPTAALLRDGSGNLFGTTYAGGSYSAGIAFELSPRNGGWKEKVLHTFNNNGTDGSAPFAPLIADPQGNLYGTTVFGGVGSCSGTQPGCGIVYELSPRPNGHWREHVLHTFENATDGGLSGAPLLLISGNLYGTTGGGGAANGGVVFQLIREPLGVWKENILHAFSNSSGDGFGPEAALVIGPSGNLYGSTVSGGTNGGGTVFELSRQRGGWTEQILHNFSLSSEGYFPYAPVIFDSAGNIYGTTEGGGLYYGGTIYQIAP